MLPLMRFKTLCDRSDHALGVGDRGLGHDDRPCYPHERQSQNLMPTSGLSPCPTKKEERTQRSSFTTSISIKSLAERRSVLFREAVPYRAETASWTSKDSSGRGGTSARPCGNFLANS